MKNIYLLFMLSIALVSCGTLKPKDKFTLPINGGVSIEEWQISEDPQINDIRSRAEKRARFMEKYGLDGKSALKHMDSENKSAFKKKYGIH